MTEPQHLNHNMLVNIQKNNNVLLDVKSVAKQFLERMEMRCTFFQKINKQVNVSIAAKCLIALSGLFSPQPN